MSSTRSSHPRVSLSQRHFDRLSSILMEANARYTAVASATRAAKSSTHHARTRAQKLGLEICTVRAAACPEKMVSTIPLPIIDSSESTPTPAAAPLSISQRGRPTLPLLVPQIPDVPYSAISLSAEAPLPIPPAVAPTVLRGQHVPWRGPTSRFSLTPNDPIFTLAPRRAPEPPVIPDVPLDQAEADAFFENWELGYPESGAADYAGSESSSSSSPTTYPPTDSSASSSSGSSSSGPVTPADAEPIASLASSGKRRREPEAIVDKRPKYERKSWARAPRKLL
ncbi:hypothetical protein DFH07DRAFT_1009692 [Mycena maculata]|uniref:Uncharacterized protein n=1 Tax=Mycena maculata TaxID=230809 RepID=A0AAD7HGF2_9AGAR|nr:hypothetical protein DFH07DRAFT_1009692 [Mycena maculata]